MKRSFCLFLLGIFLIEGAPLFGQKVPWNSFTKVFKKSSTQSLRMKSRSLTTEAALKRRIQEIRLNNAKLAAANLKERKYQSQLFDRARRSTFRAVSSTPYHTSFFTGTLFKVKHKGHEEVFGVIASHALQTTPFMEGLLNKKFKAIYIHGNVPLTIPAEVVSFTPSFMGDLALVKFPSEYETIFEPIALEEDSHFTLPARGYSQGYANNILSKQTFPIIGNTSSGILTAQLPAARLGDRAGLCGSPVFTTDFHFVGIHVGSSYKTHIGYITPVSVLRKLVQNYHSHNKAPLQSITLAGKEIGRLAMNEYVARIEILDAQQHSIWMQKTEAKFSLRQAEEEIARRPEAAFIRLTLGNSTWEHDLDGSYVFDDVSNPRIILTPWK